jgi:TolB-like protein/class 3 adenylate cyclase/Tfp pilus assembly protein PilF
MTDQLERKLTTILATDVVGYSKLMGADEEGTLKRLKAIRRDCTDPLLEKFGGRIFKTTGDGFLVEFQSVVDAVNCSISMQRKIADYEINTLENKRIIFRMGINLGDVIVDEDDIFGDGVNIAARLESISDRGGICISELVREQVRGKIPLDFTDRGEQSVKNIEKPVRVYGLTAEDIQLTKDVVLEPRFRQKILRGKTLMISAISVAALVLVSIGYSFYTNLNNTKSSKIESTHVKTEAQPSIAVLPFTAPGNEADYAYFSDGMTEEIISALGRFSDIKVISRNGITEFKGQDPKPSMVGKELGVKYVLAGSVRKSLDHIRINVRLSSAEDNTLLWSEQYDIAPSEIFNTQDQIIRRIAGTLVRKLTNIELSSIATKPANNLEAYDLVLRGRELIARVTRSSNIQARVFFKKAIELDPSYAPAYIGLGEVELNNVTDGWSQDPQQSLEKAENYALKAIEFDENSSAAYSLLGNVHIHFADYDRALDEMKRAVEINKSDPEAYAGLGTVLVWAGDIPGSIKAFETAEELGPNLTITDSMTYGLAYFLAGRFSDAERVFERSLKKNNQHSYTRAMLAATYSKLGKSDAAAREVESVKELNPRFTHNDFGSLLKDPKLREKISSALAQIGL